MFCTVDKIMNKEDLKVGSVYRAKKPKAVGIFNPVFNDRQILWIGPSSVQYDSATVKFGQKQPIIPIEKFLKWASFEVLEILPEGDWLPYKTGDCKHG